MDPLTTSAANGMRARLESLDMLANNIANSSAPGFKADREFFGLYLSQEAAESPEGTNPPVLPVIERNWTDFAQGSMTPTGSPLDLALNGKGFFVANSPTGAVFTRDGSFRTSKNGGLETLSGYPVQGADGKPIVLDSSKPVEVGPDGMIRQGGQDVGKIAIVDFQDPTTALTKRGNNYFRLDVSDVKPIAATNTQIQQGQLEAANFQPAESAVRLVNVMRQFETMQKAMSIGVEMNKRAMDEVARVT
jgi:flagellar basal-body rod protein FlgF